MANELIEKYVECLFLKNKTDSHGNSKNGTSGDFNANNGNGG